MDSDPNNTPSSEDAEIEPIPAHIVEINEQTTDIENDYRINCTDIQSLRNILDITLSEIEAFADACNLKDNRSDFLSVFSESFKNALQENINVNGLPLKMDENVKLSSDEREDHLHMVDDVLFSKLSKKVSTVAHERKFCPEQCRRIKCIEMKHEQQNLKKAKVTDSSAPSTSIIMPLEKSQNHIQEFSAFCQGFSTMQETVQCKRQEKEKLAMKIGVMKDIQKSQRICSKSAKNGKLTDVH